MTYASASDVEIYVSHLFPGGAATGTTVPSACAISAFLDRGYARINGALKARGYTTPVSSNSDVYDYVVDLEALYAAARAESVRMSARTGAGEPGRAERFMEQFDQGLTALLAMDLSRDGVTHASKVLVGGISEAKKKAQEDDTDRVKPRFKRDQFWHPSAQRPYTSDAGEED